MNEYLFRGKRVDNGEWTYGSLVSVDSYYGDDWNGAYILSKVLDSAERFDRKAIEVGVETIGQFTGRLDVNGNKIFKGDKVILSDDSDEIGIIVWDNEESEWGVSTETVQFKLGCYYDREIEIVGDIYNEEEK
jgi:hypothetical protein